MFPTYQCLQKGVRDFFILFRFGVICKKLKRPGFYTLFFTFLLITQDLEKIKKNPEHTFLDIIK